MSGYINKNKLLSSLIKDDIIKIITALGSSYKEDNKGNICCSTSLCHGGNSPYKLIYYLNDNDEYGFFHCYTCGSTYDVVSLVIRAYRNRGYSITYYKALKWIVTTTGKLNIYDDEQVTKTLVDFSWLNKIKKVVNKQITEYEPSEPINENILDIFANYPYKPWTDEYISYDAMDRFEIGYYGLNNSVTIPHRNMEGELIGIRQRYLNQADIENIGKYTPVQINGKFLSHSLGNELYGLWINKDKIKETQRVIIVEAEKSCMQGYTYYGEQSEIVACCGSNISTNQISILLNKLKVKTVMYAPDRDYHDPHSFEAEAWINRQVIKLKELVIYCDVYLIADAGYRLGYKQSPTDCGKKVFEELLNERIPITKDVVSRALTEK